MGAPEITDLGEIIAIIEGLIVGDAVRGIPAPSPALGLGVGVDLTTEVTLGVGMIPGRPLNQADFIIDKEIVVITPATKNAGGSRDAGYANAEDTVEVDVTVFLPATDNTEDQRVVRNSAFVLDSQIRGAILSPDVLEPLGLDLRWVGTVRRLALNTGTAGSAAYGSAKAIVIRSSYRMKRIESLTGGST